MDYDSLEKSDHRGNMQLAFDLASKEIGIPDLLDVEDVCDVAKPDERSLMTYIAYWFHAFSQMERVENAGRRVEKFVQNMQGAWGMQNSFEQRMRDLLEEIRAQLQEWQAATFTGTYVDAKAQSTQFAQYKRSQKRKWVAEKSELAALLGNIKTKMSTYRLRPYEPPADLRLDILDHLWTILLKSERDRSQIINETIREFVASLSLQCLTSLTTSLPQHQKPPPPLLCRQSQRLRPHPQYPLPRHFRPRRRHRRPMRPRPAPPLQSSAPRRLPRIPRAHRHPLSGSQHRRKRLHNLYLRRALVRTRPRKILRC